MVAYKCYSTLLEYYGLQALYQKEWFMENYRKKGGHSHFGVGFLRRWAPEVDVAESVYFWNGHLLILCNAFF